MFLGFWDFDLSISVFGIVIQIWYHHLPENPSYLWKCIVYCIVSYLVPLVLTWNSTLACLVYLQNHIMIIIRFPRKNGFPVRLGVASKNSPAERTAFMSCAKCLLSETSCVKVTEAWGTVLNFLFLFNIDEIAQLLWLAELMKDQLGRLANIMF